jgi:hypothetical protein
MALSQAIEKAGREMAEHTEITEPHGRRTSKESEAFRFFRYFRVFRHLFLLT